jgi:hypothetical protein
VVEDMTKTTVVEETKEDVIMITMALVQEEAAIIMV